MPRRSPIGELARELACEARIYLPGSAGEPTELVEALGADPERADGLEIVTSAIPGINPLDLERLPGTVTGLFMQPRFAGAQRAGRFRHLPVSYSGFVRYLRDGPALRYLHPPRRAAWT